MKRMTRLFLPAFLVLLVAGYLVADWYQSHPLDAQRTYIGRTSCVQCHQSESEKFVGSHHDKAMDIATESSVLGDFNDQTLEHYGITSRMFRDGDRFMINTEGTDGQMTDFEVKYVFGFTPLQQYMVELEPTVGDVDGEIGRVQVLRVSWDTHSNRWFYLSPPDVKEKLSPGDPLHWTGITQNWNTSCAECHSTDLQKNYHVTTNEYHTTFSEIDVSCEACHGPASLHVELANERSLFWDRNHGYGLAKLKSVSNVPQVQACAPCHSRRGNVKEGYQPGCNFDDYYSLQLLTYPIYQVDGQIRDEDYVYGSFLQSKMYHNGIRCTDCHDPHTAKLIHTGNQVCTSCHQHSGGKYDSENHHHHKMGTDGAACINCHMATTHYMDLDGRRDHSFRVPNPQLTIETGAGNACTACHLEFESTLPSSESANLKQYLDHLMAAENGNESVQKNLEAIDSEMAAACAKWYPASQSETKTKYYQQLAVGQHENSIDELLKLADDKRNPVIIRATAIQRMLGSNVDVDFITKSLNSSDILIQTAALSVAQERLQSLAAGSSGKEFSLLLAAVVDGLSDESTRVSQQSAWVISLLPQNITQAKLSSDDQQLFAKSLQGYEANLSVNRDRASVHLVMGGLYERQGEMDKAIQAYRNAMSVQPEMVGPRGNLAALLEQQAQQIIGQRSPDAVKRAERLSDQAKELRSKEHENLGRDAERSKGLPNTAGLNYRFGMSSYLQGDLKTAEQQLELANEKAPENQTYMLGLATFYYQMKNLDKAEALTDVLLELSPADQRYRALMKAIKAGSK